MRVRSFPLLTALVAVLALLLAPAALAGGVASVAPGLLSWTSTQFTAADGMAFDSYGQSVAIDGDTAVVGAPVATVDGKTSQGAVYVYTRSNGVWTPQTTLAASDGVAYDQFGWSVAIHNGTVAVGAPLAGIAGAAYVFTQAGGGWAEVGKVVPDVVQRSDGDVVGRRLFGFGNSVSLNGMVLAVGAPGIDEDGAAYVYNWDSALGSYALWAKLTADEETGDHDFGYAVSFDRSSDDLSLAVGAPGRWDVDGAVYLFDTLSDVWSMYQKVTQPMAAGAGQPVVGDVPQDDFGRAVSLDGDVLAVGSPVTLVDSPASVDSVGFLIPGTAYVFHRYDGTWSVAGTLTNENPELNDGFGTTVAVAAELTVLVGAPGHDVDDNTRQGAVYAYDWTGQIYQDPYLLVEGSGGSDDWLGTSLAVSDGQVLSGSPGATVGENIAQGAAWMFTLPAPTAKVSGVSPGWQPASAHLTFTGIAAEGGAAVDFTQYRVDGGDWQTGATKTIWRQGRTRVEFRAVDIFGTLGAVKAVTVRIDTKRPRVVAEAATVRAGRIARMDYKVSDPRPSSGTALMRLVVRNAAGTAVTRASTLPVTTNAWHTVHIKALRLAPGAYTVRLQAMDRAGNIQNGATTATLIVR